MTLSETIKWLSTKTIEEKILFYEQILFDFTVMNRAILLDDSINQIKCLKWSNELSHRVWNLLNDVKRGEDNNSEIRLEGNLKFYAKQSKELARFISGSLGRYDLNNIQLSF